MNLMNLLDNPRICWKPEVDVIGAMTLTPLGRNLTAGFDGTDIERLIEFGARTCTQSFGNGKPSADLHAHLVASGHGSAWRPGVFGLRVSGVTRWLTHELMRHHTGSDYLQMSTRYVDARELRFVVPARLVTPAQHGEAWAVGMVASMFDVFLGQMDSYVACLDELKKNDIPKVRRQEIARAYLPAQAETVFEWTINLQEALHVLAVRGSTAAADEIRVLMLAFWRSIRDLAPMILQSDDMLWTISPAGVPSVKGVPKVSP